MALVTTTEPASDYTRLHITPLSPTLLSAILPSSLLPAARNISYHSLQTFPERSFGFVELPVMEAQKLTKKLNGSILKGTKLKIEEARPPKQISIADETLHPPKISKEEAKKRKWDTDILTGIELRDRKVKRGWTEPAAPKRSGKMSKGKREKKESPMSKYTSGSECLFRTTLPSNIATTNSNDDRVTAISSRSERKRRSKLSKDTVIHEFSKTVKHASFLRSRETSPEKKTVTQYVEGKGWIDEGGNVVDTGPAKKNERNIVPRPDSEDYCESVRVGGIPDDLDVKASSMLQKAPKTAAVEDSSISSSEEPKGEDSCSTPGAGDKDGTQSSREKDGIQRIMSSYSTPIGLPTEIPKEVGSTSETPSIHPLEALFKTRQPNANGPKVVDPLPKFSFFGYDADSDADSDDVNTTAEVIPMTPFTQQDFAYRGVRSAAPTPDTAHPEKVYTRWPTDTDLHENRKGNSDSDDAEGLSDSPSHKHKTISKGKETNTDGATAPESDFQKWFYEHRGEANRAWKERRKIAAKEKRRRENKKGERAT
jgi:hypothetical protein